MSRVHHPQRQQTREARLYFMIINLLHRRFLHQLGATTMDYSDNPFAALRRSAQAEFENL